jgi:hypothetical protein
MSHTLEITPQDGVKYSTKEAWEELISIFGKGKEYVDHYEQELMIHEDKFTVNVYRNKKLLGHCYSKGYALEIIKHEIFNQLEENTSYKVEVAPNKEKVKFYQLSKGYIYNSYNLIDRFELFMIPKLNLVNKISTHEEDSAESKSESESEYESESESETASYAQIVEEEDSASSTSSPSESETEQEESESEAESYSYEYEYESESESEESEEAKDGLIISNALYRLLSQSI